MKTIQITIDDAIHNRLKEAAWAAMKTQGDVIRSLLDAHLPSKGTAFTQPTDAQDAPAEGGPR